MRAAILIFPGLTMLDFIGMYDPLSRLKPTGTEPEVRDQHGLVIKPDSVYLDLSPFDLLLLPGGFGTRTLMYDKHLLGYPRTWGWERPVGSVCLPVRLGVQ